MLFIPWSSTGQTTKYSLKIFKINFLGPGSEETNSLVLYEHKLRTKSKGHQWRHRQKSPDNIFSETMKTDNLSHRVLRL